MGVWWLKADHENSFFDFIFFSLSFARSRLGNVYDRIGNFYEHFSNAYEAEFHKLFN